MRTVRRGGTYYRVADLRWDDPLDGKHAGLRGGRWNPPESFAVVYLCRSVAVARANVARLLRGHPYGPEDLRPEAAPVLVTAAVREDRYLNVVTDAGCAAVGLPRSYPRDGRGRTIPHRRCQPIGLEAHERGLPGVAARSAAPTLRQTGRSSPRQTGGSSRSPLGSSQRPRITGEELAFFGRRGLRRRGVARFEQWFWA